jgi:transposase
MAATISMDLRLRVFEACQSGETSAEVAERFDVSSAFVRRLMQRYRQTGSLAPSSARRGPKPRLLDQSDRLRLLNAEHPDLTPAEIRDHLGVIVSALTVWRMLRRLGLTFKKSRSTRPSRSARTFKKRGSTGRKSSPTHRQNV